MAQDKDIAENCKESRNYLSWAEAESRATPHLINVLYNLKRKNSIVPRVSFPPFQKHCLHKTFKDITKLLNFHKS